MAKFLYSATMSLDGFIAGHGGDAAWMTDYLGPNPIVDEVIEKVGALLVGARTFGGDDPYRDTEHEGEPFGGGWSGPQFVLTHHAPVRTVPGVTFVGDLDTAVASSAEAAGDSYVNVLGAGVAAQLLERGLLDEVLVCVAPIMLGDGTRLFDRPGGASVRLERLSVSHVPHATNLWFRVVR